MARGLNSMPAHQKSNHNIGIMEIRFAPLEDICLRMCAKTFDLLLGDQIVREDDLGFRYPVSRKDFDLSDCCTLHIHHLDINSLMLIMSQ